MLKLYGTPGTRSSRVSWALEELGLDYAFHPVMLREGEAGGADFRQLNPVGKVPVLVDGELVLSESLAILTYLADRYGNGRMIPVPGTPARARHDMLATFAVAELEQPLWLNARHSFLYPEESRVPEVLPSTRMEWKRAHDALEGHLSNLTEFALGPDFTMADIVLAQVLAWANTAKYPVSEVLDAYRQRCFDRPAAKAKMRWEQDLLDAKRAAAGG